MNFFPSFFAGLLLFMDVERTGQDVDQMWHEGREQEEE